MSCAVPLTEVDREAKDAVVTAVLGPDGRARGTAAARRAAQQQPARLAEPTLFWCTIDEAAQPEAQASPRQGPQHRARRGRKGTAGSGLRLAADADGRDDVRGHGEDNPNVRPSLRTGRRSRARRRGRAASGGQSATPGRQDGQGNHDRAPEGHVGRRLTGANKARPGDDGAGGGGPRAADWGAAKRGAKRIVTESHLASLGPRRGTFARRGWTRSFVTPARCLCSPGTAGPVSADSGVSQFGTIRPSAKNAALRSLRGAFRTPSEPARPFA